MHGWVTKIYDSTGRKSVSIALQRGSILFLADKTRIKYILSNFAVFKSQKGQDGTLLIPI